MAATFNGNALDEIVHNRQDVIGWWVNVAGGQPMDENMIHRYLETSPYFDYTTKNGLVFTQAMTDYNLDVLVGNRKRLEEALRKQIGPEYMIVSDPKPAEGAENSLPRGTTGVYVIRKQDRQRARGLDGRMEDELTTLATYYTVGDNLYQAPSVADLVGNRMLLVQKHIDKFYETAAALPSFDPAAGGFYWYKSSSKPATASTSTPGTPRSREGSVAAGADSQSLRSGSVDLGGQASGESASTIQHDRLLAQSFSMSTQFGDEYMDENPIIGEPGHFTFTSSTAAVKKRKADEEAAAAKIKAEQEAAKSRPTSPKVPKAALPPAIMSESKTAKADKDRKASRTDKIKRKKSKASNLSPVTPGAGPSSSS